MTKNPCTCPGCDRCEPVAGQCGREAVEGPDQRCQPCVADAAIKAQPQVPPLPPKRASVSQSITPGTDHLTIAGTSAAVIWGSLSYHEKLLDKARASLNMDKNPDMAVVIAQAACEVRTEQAIRVLLEKKGLLSLSDPLLKLFATSNICNDRLRDIYNALSNSQIQNEHHFWQKLKDHYDRRNAIVHKGESCTDAKARASLEAVEAYFTHLNSVIENLG